MGNKDHQLIKYLKYAENKLKIQLNNSELNENVKLSLNSKIDNIADIIEKISFQLKSPDEKQAFRIEWIASLRKRDMPIESKLSTIRLYDKIREVLPYLAVLNQNAKPNDLIDLCYEELELIDFSGRNFGDNHISLASVKPLFEKLTQNEEALNVHPEAIDKVRGLYREFEKALNG
jgi:hypothetical protein